MAMADITPSENANVAEALNGVAKLYEENLKSYGQTSKSVGWKDEASQILRFEKLAQVIDPGTAHSGISVNDLGCGYAAMFRYLDALPSVKLSRYYGYDISEKMLEEAGRAVGNDSRAVFIRSSKLTEAADYSFVSGTYNVKLEASDEEWADHIKESLENLAAMSRRGFAFNLLTTYVDWKQENLYYADPFMFFDFCKRNISPYVSLLHDYPLYEWTLLVRNKEYPG
jgi:SAM-dependent methyltransferase